MMRNYYERLEEVFEVNIQLFMQSRICTTNFVNIDPIYLNKMIFTFWNTMIQYKSALYCRYSHMGHFHKKGTNNGKDMAINF